MNDAFEKLQANTPWDHIFFLDSTQSHVFIWNGCQLHSKASTFDLLPMWTLHAIDVIKMP